MVKVGTTYRIVSDERSSPRLIVNGTTGKIAQELDYDSYGRITKDTSPGFQPFGFAGGLYDSDTGLTHFGARDYDPETGRFISEDPLDFSGGDTNLYSYAWGDPVNFVDPTGLGGFGIGSWLKDRASHYGREAFNFDVAATNVITGGGVEATLTLTGGLSQINTCSGSYKLGVGAGFVASFLLPMGAAARAEETVVETTGQLYHAISNPIARALSEHLTLAGKYSARDSRFVTRAVDEAAHRGYQTSHRELDSEVAAWLAEHEGATTEQFEQFLRVRYAEPDLVWRFPNGFE